MKLAKGYSGAATANNIRVAVRVRPPLENELQSGNTFEKLRIDQTNKIVK